MKTALLAILALLLVALVAMGQTMYIAPQGTTVPFSVQLQGSTGTVTAGDNSPAWSVRDLSVSTVAIATGTYSVGTDALNNAGYYVGTLNLNASTYAVGHWYTIRSVGTVSGVAGARDTAVVYVTDGTLSTGGKFVFGTQTISLAGTTVNVGSSTLTTANVSGINWGTANFATDAFKNMSQVGNATTVFNLGTFTSGHTNFGVTSRTP